MEDFPGNSRKAQNAAPVEPKEEKKIESVVSGKVLRRKKPLGKRFLSTFFGSEDASSVWSYVFHDVMVPAAKDMISDAFSQGIERMLFGEARGRSRSSSIASRTGSPYVNYRSMSSGRREEPVRREISHRARVQHDFDEIMLETKVEAEEVLDSLVQIISQFDVATVSDLYELCGQKAYHTDEKYGWTSLLGAAIIRMKGGYLLDLPRPEPLNN